MYMHLGTFIAHLFGGFAHAFFPNRASDGVGMVGFYVTIGIELTTTQAVRSLLTVILFDLHSSQ
jgi:hypothetical protein